MHDIYDNLENYEDANDVTKLKNENKGLKQKVEEYSRAMNQLQKDFDKLNTEYKKLEFNYSSLLKTARAEIERKGEIIKNLNTEKDKLIISALQTKGKHMSKNENQKCPKDQNNHSNTDKVKRKQHVESKDNRLDCVATSVPTISSTNKENKIATNITKVDKLINIGKHSEINTESKENISKKIHKSDTPSDKTLSQTISNRRKSIPASSFQEAKFSSDEESDKLYVKNVRKSPHRASRHDHRDYRTDLMHSLGSSESSRSRNSNYIDYNTQRHNDYEMKQYHRNYSPEKYQHRYSDYNRQRILKSPPSDKYNRSKSRDRRSNYERETYDRHRHYEHSSLKHKMRTSIDEPHCKRQKTELYSKCPSQDSNYISDREKEFVDRRYISEPEFEQLSCQSPDYSDNHYPQHLIKEIRHTAATSLEDPRISSKKYILQSYNDRTFLVIPSVRDIDIPCIDKMSWGLEKVKVPDALKNKPISDSENENHLNQIYDNIENNESIESGEIQSIEDDVVLSKAPENHTEQSKLDFNRKQTCSNIIDMGQKAIMSEVRQSSSTSGYKIPKIKKVNENSENPIKNDSINNSNNVDIKRIQESNTKFKESNSKTKHNQTKHNPLAENITTGDNLEKSNNNNQNVMEKAIQEKIRTVEGDLELSDEESDTMEVHKEIESKVMNNESSKHSSMTTKIFKPCTNSSIVEKKEPDSLENEVGNKTETENTVSQEFSSTKKSSSKDSSRDGKKRRSKKKSESKETSSNKDIKDKKKNSEKSNKNNIPEQTVNKFSDLFGDTSSLITPDDLGIPASYNKVQTDVKYASLFDNTQDAMDLNVEDANKSKIDQPNEQSITNVNFNTVIAALPIKVDENINKSNGKCEKANTEDQHSNDNNENSKTDTLMETNNVVKTVIISSGVQLQRECDKNSPELPVLDVDKSNETNSIKRDALDNVNALATSTPYKPIAHDDKMTSSQESGTMNTSDISLGLSTSNVNNSSINNTNRDLTEDVPDVRIIVRRKRKVLRKPT